ncbi:hypothetical protein [Caulobacter sp. UC70_42]|uniref:hypothetical protein n=1 Tax=Caulobacter sp. UC70_42 TaxID=3374551 RepID=UPI003757C745
MSGPFNMLNDTIGAISAKGAIEHLLPIIVFASAVTALTAPIKGIFGRFDRKIQAIAAHLGRELARQVLQRIPARNSYGKDGVSEFQVNSQDDRHNADNIRKFAAEFVATIFLAIFAAFSAFSIRNALLFWLWLTEQWPKIEPLFPYFTVAFGVIVAQIFFWLRDFNPKIYGSLEMIIGAVGMYFAPKSPDTFTASLAFAGAVYVFVRGRDNFSNRKKKYN